MVGFELSEGTVFAGDYRVTRPLAKGGMGAVYVADQLSTGKQRALKVMHPLLASDEKARERFVQEAKVGGLVDSDHVVQVLAAGVDEASSMPWLAMELLEGETLQDRLEARGAMPAHELGEIAGQLAHALALAHRRGLVHRDLKPENLFLERPRRAGVPFTLKILDFGIAKLVQLAQGRNASGTQPLGSPLWMAPEQANAGHVSPSTDVWALGLIAFTALTGTLYWRTAATEGDLHLTKLLVEILVDPLVPASMRAAELGAAQIPGPRFDAWFARCLAREPEHRFQDAGACLDTLIALLREEPVARRAADSSSLPTADTAPAASVTPQAMPSTRGSGPHPSDFEPIVARAPSSAPSASHPPTRAGGSMGLGQIAAIIAGSVLVAFLVITGGVAGYAAFSVGAEEEADHAAPPPATSPAPPTPQASPMQPMAPPAPTPEAQPTAPPAPTPTPNPDPPLQDPRVGGEGPISPTPTPIRRPRTVARSAAARAFYEGAVRHCWQEELGRTRHGSTRMVIDLQLGAGGMSVSNARVPSRWQGTPFARCVIGSLPRVRFSEPAARTRVVLQLPGAR